MMKAVCYRIIRSRALLLLLLLLIAAMPLAGMLGSQPAPEGAAFCIAADGLPAEDAAALRVRLAELDFAEAADEAALRAGLHRGDWGCGLILTDGDALLLHTENAANAELWRGAAAAALFSVRAPDLTAEALADSGISAEEAHRRYNELYAQGSPFAVRVLRTDGLPPKNDLPRDRVLAAGAAACLLAAVFAAALPVFSDDVLLRRRISDRGVRAGAFAAQLALRFVLLALAAVLGAALAGYAALSLRLLPYLLLCTLLAALALRLTRSPGAVSVAAAMLCLLIPVLCPVYTDLSLAAPKLAAVQKLFLPYWLFVEL